LYRVLSFSAVALAVKFLVGFVLTKLFALFLGPSGLALLGNLKNFTQLLHSYGTLGMQSGIIRFASEWKSQPKKIANLVGTLNIIFTISALIGGSFIFFFSSALSLTIFQNTSFDYIFKIIAVILPLQGFHLMYYSILQGLGNYKRVVWQAVLMDLIKVALTSILVLKYDLVGALIAMVVAPVFYFLLSVWNTAITLKIFRYNWSKAVAKNLALYAMMSLFSSIAIPIVYIVIRNKITTDLGVDNAGYWEAANQFSFFYFMVLNSIIMMYVLPKISENQKVSFFRKQASEYFLKLIPVFVVGLVLLFLFRDIAIWILFDDSFRPVSELMLWQLLGDVFRAASLVLVAYIHAHRLITHYITIDLVLSFSLILFSFFFIEQFGLIGAVRAHFVSYLIYFVAIVFLLRKTLFWASDE
jgi:O-antigen/teichoic acid export membrane protein